MPKPAASAAARLVAAALLSLSVTACSSAGASPSMPASAAPHGSSPAASAGSSASSSPAASAGSSPVASIDLAGEVDATVAGLDGALSQYRAGSTQAALDLIAATYEDHFEKVENPLEGLNAGLRDDLESLIATRLRAAMTAKQPVADVEALVTEAKGKLMTAKGLLQRP